jgi:dTDP-glucose 4,6-dehydratase
MFKKYGSLIHLVNLDSLTYAGNLENLKEIEGLPNYEFVRMDICDKEGLSSLFQKYDFDRIVHFAAESHVDRSIQNPDIFAKTNILGTLNLLNAAKEAWQTKEGFLPGKRYLQVSTDEVYGSLPEAGGYFYETTPLDPHSPYSASKASADMLVKAYMDTYRFPASITRCSNNYGPYQFPEKLIPLMIRHALLGKPLPVYGDGKNVRDWLYVVDHAKAIDLVCEQGQPFSIYNVGGHNEKQNIEIVKLILDTLLELLPKEDVRREHISYNLIQYVEDRKGHDRRYAIAPDKIKKELGWEPETMFSEGIRLTIQWYLENEAWIQNIEDLSYRK